MVNNFKGLIIRYKYYNLPKTIVQYNVQTYVTCTVHAPLPIQHGTYFNAFKDHL